MNDFKYKMARFFQGRTGVDALGRTFSWLAILLLIVTVFTHSGLLYLLALACLVYSTWRMLSRNYQKRYLENQKFLQATAGIRRFFKGLSSKIRIKRFFSKLKYDHEQRKIYTIFYCPSCKQKLRAPKGRGRIQVTCSKCHQQFIKKV